MNNSFITVAAAIPAVKVADCDYNIEQIIAQVTEAEEKGVEIIVFPELCVTGYTCQDLFRQSTLLENVELSVVRLLGHMRKMNVIAIIGIPVIVGDLLLNCAAVIQKGSILAMIPKTYLPNYNEFYEKRWFASLQDLRETQIRYAGNKITITPESLLVRTSENVLFGVEICEDVWAPAPPSNRLALSGADLIFNLSASDELVGKHDYLKGLLAQQSARTITGYIYSGSGFGESTQDVVYGGNAMIYENGVLLEEADRFSLEPQMMIGQIDIERLRSERRTNSTYVNAQRGNNAIIVDALPTDSIPFTLIRKIDPHPFIPASSDMQRSCEEIINIQSCGLAKRVIHTNSKNLVVGISGLYKKFHLTP